LIVTLNRTYSKSENLIEQEAIEIDLAKKNPEKFAPLYERYFLQIFKYVFKRVESEELANDICQQTFIKALTKIGSYQHKGLPFSSWLYRIAQNEINQEYRNKKRARVVDVNDSELPELFEEIEVDINDERRKKLLNALKQLSPAEVSLIEMKYFEKRSGQEISEILDISLSNVKVKLHRTVKKIKNIISES
jgi:RNA polymerase sigma-70 factor (ECF subfamily)